MCDQEWRRGDVQPFRLDGRPEPREPLDPLKSMRMPRVTQGGDTSPWSLAGGASPRQRALPAQHSARQPSPERLVAAAVDGGGSTLMPLQPKRATRERRVTREREDGMERLQEMRPLEEVVLNMRRGELRY